MDTPMGNETTIVFNDTVLEVKNEFKQDLKIVFGFKTVDDIENILLDANGSRE